jgi:hypothetical protein
MLALFSRFVRWLKGTGVRAPETDVRKWPYRPVRRLTEIYELQCGHRVEIRKPGFGAFPCRLCPSQSANEQLAQPVESVEKSADTKGA